MNGLTKPRKVLECASPLALLDNIGHLKAAEDCRTPRRYRAYSSILPSSSDLARDASDGNGDFRSRLELGGNCEFAGLILGQPWRSFGSYAALSGMRFCTSLFIMAAVLLCGCSYTYNGGGLGRTSPDGRFELGIESDGAYGHAYDDKTKKKIWIWIGSGSGTNYTELFRHRYVVTGSDIEWQTHWSSAEAVSVEIYDWGDGVGNYNNMLHMIASNHIALLSFVLDKNTNKFIEQK